jgi:hypothetical protein
MGPRFNSVKQCTVSISVDTVLYSPAADASRHGRRSADVFVLVPAPHSPGPDGGRKGLGFPPKRAAARERYAAIVDDASLSGRVTTS